MKKLALLLLSSVTISFNSCKKEERQLEPTQQTTNNSTPTSPKIYTYKNAHIYQVKFFALSSTHNNDYIRFEIKNGAATIFQSTSNQYQNNLPFSLFDYYNTTNLITDFNTLHTLNLDYKEYSSDPYTTFVYWNFTPANYVPAPSTVQQKDTTISQSTPDSSVVFDVTFKFTGE